MTFFPKIRYNEDAFGRVCKAPLKNVRSSPAFRKGKNYDTACADLYKSYGTSAGKKYSCIWDGFTGENSYSFYLGAKAVRIRSGAALRHVAGTAAGETCTLRVNDLVFQDVVFGEVWLAGGQSNMEFMLKNAKGGAEELKQCPDPSV